MSPWYLAPQRVCRGCHVEAGRTGGTFVPVEEGTAAVVVAAAAATAAALAAAEAKAGGGGGGSAATETVAPTVGLTQWCPPRHGLPDTS